MGANKDMQVHALTTEDDKTYIKSSWNKGEVIYLAKCMALSTLGSKDSRDIFIACDKWIEKNL